MRRVLAVAAAPVMLLGTCQPAAPPADPAPVVYSSPVQPGPVWESHAGGLVVTDEGLRTAWVSPVGACRDKPAGVCKVGAYGWGNRFHSVKPVSPPYSFSGRLRVTELLPKCGDAVDRYRCHTATWRPGITFYAAWVDDDNNVAIGVGLDRTLINAFKEVDHRYGGVDGLFRPHWVDVGRPVVELGRWHTFRVESPACGRYRLWWDGALVIDTQDPNPRWCVDVQVGIRADFHDVTYQDLEVAP